MRSLRAALSSRWVRLALSAALLAVLAAETDLRAMRGALATAALGWVAAALVGLAASQTVSAYRWYLLGRAVGFDESFARYCLYYFSGLYLNLFGPGTITGDVGRTLFLAGGGRRALALTTVIAHRAVGFVALVWITAAATLVLPDQPLPAIARWLAALAIPGTVLGWLWGPRLVARLLPPANNWRLLVERDLAPYWHNQRLLATSLAFAALAHGLQLASQVLVAWALRLSVPWAFVLIVVPLVNMLGMVPFSLQGVGVRETGYLYYLSRIGVSRETALAVGLLTSAITLAIGLLSFPFFLLLRQRPASAAEAMRTSTRPALAPHPDLPPHGGKEPSK